MTAFPPVVILSAAKNLPSRTPGANRKPDFSPPSCRGTPRQLIDSPACRFLAAPGTAARTGSPFKNFRKKPKKLLTFPDPSAIIILARWKRFRRKRGRHRPNAGGWLSWEHYPLKMHPHVESASKPQKSLKLHISHSSIRGYSSAGSPVEAVTHPSTKLNKCSFPHLGV